MSIVSPRVLCGLFGEGGPLYLWAAVVSSEDDNVVWRHVKSR